MVTKNALLQGQHGKPILVDQIFKQNGLKKPIILFSHGFKGFKDFACFNLFADEFAESGFYYVKFNFSHNGTSPDHPVDFVDLEAFSNNNFSIELDDLGTVIDWLFDSNNGLDTNEFDLDQLYLIGHSRGGGISILKAAEDKRVKKLATWAAVNVFGRFWSPEAMQKWKEEGIMIVKNGRTKQDMPMKYQAFVDYEANKSRLYIPDAVKGLTIPFLAAHGDEDPTVSVDMAKEMKAWNSGIQLEVIKGANHVFGGKHPWTEKELPPHSKILFKKTLDFFRQ